MRYLLPLLLVPSTLAAQEGATVSGRVLSEADGTPLPVVSVVIEEAASGEAISGALTSEDGWFFIRGLGPDQYIVRVSFPGFFPEQWDLVVSEINPVYDFGDLRLRSVGELDEISVVVDGTRTAGINTQVGQVPSCV